MNWGHQARVVAVLLATPFFDCRSSAPTADGGDAANDGDSSLAPDCGRHGVLVPDTAGGHCECDAGYMWVGTCVQAACAVHCVHGTCDSRRDPPVCVCGTGYAGDACDACDTGYEQDARSGRCVPSCTTGGYTCDGHGACADTSDGPACRCDPGYGGDGPVNCLPLAGTDCGNPETLDLQKGYAQSSTLAGSTVIGSGCGSGQTQAHAFRITLPTPQTVLIKVSANWLNSVSVRRSCASPATDLTCVPLAAIDPATSADVITFRVALDVGDWFVIVEAPVGVEGSDSSDPYVFGIAVKVECPAGQAFAWDTQTCVTDPCDPNPCVSAHQHDCHTASDGSAGCRCDSGYRPDPTMAQCTAPAQPQGSSCDDAIPLPIGVQQTVTAAAVHSRDASACGSGAGLHFGFYLPQRSRVHFWAGAGFGTAVSVLRHCDDSTSALSCRYNNMLGHDAAVGGGTLDPGSYALVANGFAPSATVTLEYSIAPDPCVVAPPSCGPSQTAIPDADWTSCSCACADGFVVSGSTCAVDPCAPNPCTDSFSRCMVDDAAAYHCECPLGMIPDGGSPGSCRPDPTAAEWTVLVYESYDNNLGVCLPVGPTQMGDAVVSTTPVHVVWLSASPANDATLYHLGSGAPLTSVATWTAPDMSDWRTLRDLGILAASYPAHHYALVIADHGNHWQFSWDSGYGERPISVADGGYERALGAIVRTIGQHLDIVHFATCLMATWEVADATAAYAKSLLASPQEAYGNLSPIVAITIGQDPTKAPADVAHEAVDRIYNDSLSDPHPGENVESWTDLTSIQMMTARLNELANALAAHPDLCGEYEAVRESCLPYPESEFGPDVDAGDIGCWAVQLATAADLPQEIRVTAASLADAVAAAVYVQPAGTSGLSIYLPILVLPAGSSSDDRRLTPDYVGPGAVWTQDSTWDDFLATCRAQ